MVVVEGVSRSLNPQINIWQVAQPIVEAYIRKSIGPAALLKDLSKTARVLARFGPRLPDLVETMLINQAKTAEVPSAPRPSRLVFLVILAFLLGFILAFIVSKFLWE